MNKKGFTLVELLASLVILSIILLIAVPSTVNVLDRTKKQKYISDAKRMITLAEAYIRANEDIAYPEGNQVLIFYLSRLNDGTFDEDPEGNKYDLTRSFVTVVKKNNGTTFSYDFSAQLVGVNTANNKNRGVELSNLTVLNSDQANDKVKRGISNAACSNILKSLFGNNSGTCIPYN